VQGKTVYAECEADAECNPSYNSSAHQNNHWGYKGSAAINSYVPTPGFTGKFSNSSITGKDIATDADLALRNAKLGGSKQGATIYAQCEADTECNPAYNSSAHPNNHYGASGSAAIN